MEKEFKSITEAGDLSGKKVLLRASLDVPTRRGAVMDVFRVHKALKTIEYLRERGACIIIIAHLGREPENTLRPIYEYLKKINKVNFVEDIVGDRVHEAISSMASGDVLLLENLRRDPGEKNNDATFSKALAGLADIYVNDAFANSHRKHASIIGVPEFLPSYAGLLFETEVLELSKARSPSHPALFILGGAKFNTKMPLITKFLDIYDHVFVGGALANDFYKAMGYNVGKSLISDKPPPIEHLLSDKRIMLPNDVTVLTPSGNRIVKKPSEVLDDEIINDCGPETLRALEQLALDSEFILWNGPIGDYQHGFTENTEMLARTIIASGAHTIAGGGDTMSLLAKLDLGETFSFASTAGGAMLEYLLEGTLPGIEALKKHI